ncbi:MAG: rhamnogalacturonan acetylesterase [Deltaproteobacteria bacterium]|jgi:lysophospholipase L1-like esterase|nr:rhamnogalacturonan acetylesterase [Deltaproteobacteria bacterium]
MGRSLKWIGSSHVQGSGLPALAAVLLVVGVAVTLLHGCDGAEDDPGDGGGASGTGAPVGGAAGQGGQPAAGSGTGGESGGAGGSAPLVETEVWLIGDSTVSPDSGWGDSLEDYLADEATVHNRARSGRSSKSFREETGNYWTEHPDAVMNHLAAGDYVLIQFGHNDEKDDVERHTEPGSPPDYQDTFRQYLESYIDDTRSVGATPVLITPVSRMSFDSAGAHLRTHGDYPAAMLQTGSANGVVVLDLELRSHQRFDQLGETQTLELFSDGVDRTHFPADKAWRVAEMVAELLAESTSPLGAYVRP